MRSQHVWISRDENGRKREVRVTKFGGAWRFQAKYREEKNWTYYDRPLTADLNELRDIIFRKYQRRRASAEDFAAVDKMWRDRSRDE